jgi:UDP-N-acetylglucosamine--N-acetylmuramyl-(pentapeptide) pyrophosphoryl-undecaprenol N-acetylglucosamine transferase
MELNAVPGRATRLLARFAAGIGLAAPAALEGLPAPARCRVTGTPLRGKLDREADPEAFGLAQGRPTLLVVGGSQGARGLNTRVLEGVRASADLPFQVLHCAGPADAARVRALYRDIPVASAVVDFLPDIGRAYAVADVVLARSGASTVAECLVLGKPAVFVPYPWHRDRQQARNAEAAVRAGAARLVEEESLTSAAFRRLVEELLLDGAARERMRARAPGLARPDAARAMAAHLFESLGEAVGEAPWLAEIGG